MTEAIALLDLHDNAVAEVQRLTDLVTAEQLDRPTPCADWDVQSLLGHLVAGNQQIAAASSGGSLRGLLGEVAPQADSAAYAESARKASAAWKDPAALAQERGSMLLTVHLIECVLHGWDLATATGQRASFDERILDVIEPFAHQMMPVERPEGSGFAPAREPGPGADRLDRLAAFYGREA